MLGVEASTSERSLVLATARDVPDPHALELVCRLFRGGARVYEGRVNTGEMKRRCPELVEWLSRDNPIPPGTVLSTGTGILVPDEHALQDGDQIQLERSVASCEQCELDLGLSPRDPPLEHDRSDT